MKMLWLFSTLLLGSIIDSGLSEADVGGRIYNGFRATRGQFPYQARLIQKLTSGSTGCGGSLIADNWVLTAAHCADGATSATVYLGLIDTQNGTGALTYQVQASGIYIHPQYNRTTVQNDIALYKLPSSVPLNQYSYIKTIALPRRSETPVSFYDNYNGTASGYGLYNDTSGGSRYQLYAPVHIMVQSQCVSYYSSVVRLSVPITDGMLCTDKTVFYHGGCSGDSGGPVSVNNAGGNPTVVGIASFIVGNCSNKNPVVNTFPGKYLDWINSITGIAIQP